MWKLLSTLKQSGHERTRIFLFLFLLAAVLPSALVLWFTSVAIRNEQLARRQLEFEARENHFEATLAGLQARWRQHLDSIVKRIVELPPALAFKEVVLSPDADGLIILAPDSSGQVLYPSQAISGEVQHRHAYRKTGQLLRPENESNLVELLEAPINASSIAEVDAVTRNLRNAVKNGDGEEVEDLLNQLQQVPYVEQLFDDSGRHLLSNIELYMLEHRDILSEQRFSVVKQNLVRRLNGYENYLLTSQRRFLMSRVLQANGVYSHNQTLFPTYTAEVLSNLYLDSNRTLTVGVPITLARQEIWQVMLPGGQGIVLFNKETLSALFSGWLLAATESTKLHYAVDVKNNTDTNRPLQTSKPLHAQLQDWQLQLIAPKDGSMNVTSLGAIYISMSVVSVLLIVVVLYCIARLIVRRMTLAQQKNTMVATVSHELKTPVSAIKLLVDSLLQDVEFKPKRVREYLGLIARENLRLGQLIENFLSYSRMERTQFTLKKELIDVRTFVDDIVATFRQQIELKEDSFDVVLSEPLPSFCGDPWALARVLLNLLDNAYKYSLAPRKISLIISCSLTELSFSVEDNGIGISYSERENIFNQFYQIDQKLSRTAEGCGLGLCIVQEIVHLHGGRVELQSSLGKGSTFTIKLPLTGEA